MRLSEWRKSAPTKESLSNRVVAILKPVLEDLGAEADAECWVAWGDDPEMRYSVLAPTVAGLVTVAVRLSGPDGPRATAKLVRWSKLSVSELGIEASGGHRIVAVQVETLVLKGVDDEADRICEFVRGLIAGIDGRHPQLIPISVVQSVAAAGTEATRGRPTPAKAPSKRVVAEARPAAGPKPPRPAVLKAVPKAPKASKPARKSLEKPAALALVPPPTEPTAPPTPPTPMAARVSVAQHGDQPSATPDHPVPVQPEPEPERSGWIGPHPIEEPPDREPSRPRPWMP